MLMRVNAFSSIAQLWLKAALHEEGKTLKRLEGLNRIATGRPELDGSNKIASAQSCTSDVVNT